MAPSSRALSPVARSLLLTAGLALVIRIVSLIVDSRLPFFRYLILDAELYDASGRAIANGDLTLGREVLHMSPLYCYFLGLIYKLFGAGVWMPRLLQVLIGTLTVVCIHDAARRLFGARWGLAAGVAAACYGPFIFYDAVLLADGLAAMFAAAFLWSLLIAREASRLRWWLLSGAIWGLAIVTRPNTLTFAFPLLVTVLLKASPVPRWKALGATALAAALFVLPVTARNVLVAGEWVLVTDSGGMNFYIGNGPSSLGTFSTPAGLTQADKPRDQFPLYRAAAEKAVGHPLSWRETDAYWFSTTWQHIRTHPLRWGRLMTEKLWLFWNAREIPNAEDYEFARTVQPVLAMPWLQFGVLAPFALLGTALFLRRRRPGELLVATMVLTLCAMNVLVFIIARYRIGAVPALMLAGIGGLHWLVEAWRQKAWKTLALMALVAVPVVVLVWTPKLPRQDDIQFMRYGVAAYQQKDLASAEWAFLQAAQVNPNALDAFKNLAVMYDEAGIWQQSKEAWQAVIRIASATRDQRLLEIAQQRLDYAEHQLVSTGER